MENNKPSCFGISICYTASSECCKKCRWKKECIDLGKKETLKVSERLPEAKSILHKRLRGSEDSNSPRSKASTKIVDSTPHSDRNKRILKSLQKQGIDVKECAKDKINPFADTNKFRYLDIAFDMLLEGGFTKASLRARFISELNCSSATLRSYESTTLAILQAHDVVKCEGSKFKIKDNR